MNKTTVSFSFERKLRCKDKGYIQIKNKYKKYNSSFMQWDRIQ